ncbi:1-phosphofructokinase [Xylanimonas oleitrophica]|uniref:1-phosphofructokinase n=1 Tax=Xylanimonas oleitrophica TaxID=2607479 RepID=A0A2W5WUU3_9MICO|nr:1-phosphofructokinase family hexose kinase [Xylanimonas oleitrophica]PZR54920.1 1-phosphofructokinase [Xylanimonas oleitrophica]
MIVTVTPNPSLDRTFDVGALHVGEVNRALDTHVHPGGKGINVSRALARHGVATRAVLPTGGADGVELAHLLGGLGIASRAVPVREATRSNVAVVDAAGTTTKVNAAGPALDPAEAAALVAAVEAELEAGAAWLVLAGSLPRAGGDDLYLRLIDAAGARGVPAAVDASGAALHAVADHGGAALLKPNLEELEDLLGAAPRTVGEIVDGARAVLARGHGQALVSLGADGALLVTPDACWWAGGPPLVPRSTVGAGDCTLAGFLAAHGDVLERLRTAVAWGRAAVALPGSAAPGPEDVDLTAVRAVAEPPAHLHPAELLELADQAPAGTVSRPGTTPTHPRP